MFIQRSNSDVTDDAVAIERSKILETVVKLGEQSEPRTIGASIVLDRILLFQW